MTHEEINHRQRLMAKILLNDTTDDWELMLKVLKRFDAVLISLGRNREALRIQQDEMIERGV